MSERIVAGPVSRDEQDLHDKVGADADVGFRAGAADLDRMGADLFPISHDGVARRSSRRLSRHRRGNQ